MWLLKFHTAFSILCLIVVLYVLAFLSKERRALIKRLFHKETEKESSMIELIIGCYVPMVNLLLAIAALVLMFASEDTLRDLANRRKDG